MKCKAESPAPAFRPFDVTITIESQAEAAGLYSLFNHSVLLDKTGLAGNGCKLRDAIYTGHGSTPAGIGEIYTKLCQVIK
jgi:hypothetical protein